MHDPRAKGFCAPPWLLWTSAVILCSHKTLREPFFSGPQWSCELSVGSHCETGQEDPDKGRHKWQDCSLNILRASPQVLAVMPQYQRLVRSKGSHRPTGSRANLLKVKVFTLHPGLRDAQIPPGNRRQLTDTQESKAETVKRLKKKICLSLLVPRDRQFIFLRTQELILRQSPPWL